MRRNTRKYKGAQKGLLQERADRSKQYLDIAGVIIVAIDANQKIVLINKRGCEILGCAQKSVIGKNWFNNFIPERERANVKKVFTELMHGKIKPVEYFENYILTRRGKEKIIAWHNAVLKDKTGKITGTISSGEDITERKRTEEALLASERRYHRIFSAAGDGICITDFNGDILEVNPQMCKMHGYSYKELIGTNAKKLVHHNSAHLFEKFKRDSQKGIGFYAEAVDVRKDGTPVNIEVTGSTIDFKSKKTLLAILRDITGRKKAEAEREKLTKALIKSNEKLKESSLVDIHTGLYNHHYLEDVLEAEFYRARRSATALSLIMMDINYFKSINEVYGHHFGDLVLKQFATQLKRVVRKYDIVVRFGGEEFIIVSPGIDKTQALILAQRFLDSLNLYNFGDKKHSVKLKVSIGVASYPEDKAFKGMDLVGLLERVLTRVKEDGGDKVYSSSDIAKGKSTEALRPEEQRGDVKLLKDKMNALSKRANQSVAEAISAFAKTIEVKDHYTGEHVEKTVNYAADTAAALGLPREEVSRIRQAAILHDLGKIGISEKILMKKGKLTEKEFEEIKKHPLIAVDIIRPIQFFHDIIPLILYHHERWDGKGYPYGLKRDEIPVGAQIISIADEYQALISDRPYRKAYTNKEAMEIIKQEAGTRFDPAIVNVFIKVISEKK